MRWAGEHDSVRVLSTPEELTSVPAVKLLARSASAQSPDDFYELISRTLGGVAEATHSSSSALVEISASGVTKAAGLAWLCEREGFAPTPMRDSQTSSGVCGTVPLRERPQSTDRKALAATARPRSAPLLLMGSSILKKAGTGGPLVMPQKSNPARLTR